ncbi:MAG: HD domain-containing protein [Succinivibrionaceae bacterium]|nr:HD domain-containing protein [Succinivibrionaceae bacterium]
MQAIRTIHRHKSLLAVAVILLTMLNTAGDAVARFLDLPMWFDTLGTLFAAYLFGPVVGAIVGLSGNLLTTLINGGAPYYAAISVIIGVWVGIAARRKKLETFYGMMLMGTLLAFCCAFASAGLNMLLFDGMSGNRWGDAVIAYFRSLGLESMGLGLLCYLLGQLYLEFLDKILCMLILFTCIHLFRGSLRDHAAGAVVAACCLALPLAPQQARASEDAVRSFPDFAQTIFDSSNGLSCGEANDIAQTSDGIIWLATYAGLYRYDGREFSLVSQGDSIRSVNCLHADHEGRLWIGSNDSGLTIYAQNQVVSIATAPDMLPSDSIKCIGQDMHGNYFVGTADGVVVLSLSHGLKKVAELPEIKSARSIVSDAQGRTAILSASGRLFLIDGHTVADSLSLSYGIASDESFNSLAFDHGRLLVGTSKNHVFYYTCASGRLHPERTVTIPEARAINDISRVDSLGSLFISSDTGIFRLEESGDSERIRTGDFDNSVEHMEQDYQGNLWFVSSRQGLLKLAPTKFKELYVYAGLPAQVVNAVARRGSLVYSGTDKGLDIIDMSCAMPVENALTALLEGVRVRTIIRDRKDNLLIGAYGPGLVKQAPDGTITTIGAEDGLFSNRVRALAELGDGTLAVGGVGGVSLIDPSGAVNGIEGWVDQTQVLCLAERGAGTIYAGTDGNGIAVIENGRFTRYIKKASGLSSNIVLRMVQDEARGGLYIVTSNGLCYMDAAGSIRFLRNFPYYNNYDVVASKRGRLFVTSSAGLITMQESDLLSGKRDPYHEIFDHSHGLGEALTANSWNYLDENEDFYMCASTGIVLVNLNDYKLSDRAFMVRLAKVTTDGHLWHTEAGVPFSIPQDTERLTISPEIVNYTNEDPLVRYQLVGFERNPNTVPLHSLSDVTYNHLPSGEYTFELSVIDRNSMHTLSQRAFPFRKDLADHETPWFHAYLLIGAALFVVCVTWLISGAWSARIARQLQHSNETILTIAKALDARDLNTSKHSQRVADYSVLIARELGWSEARCKNLHMAALLHDIGKIGIRDNILNKPSRLTDEEYATMKKHVIKGAEILKNFTSVEHVVDGARYHHERYDGKGYCEGRKGKDIPEYGRIIGIADAFDAMTANRVYRKRLSMDIVRREIENCSGTQFDPDYARILLSLIDRGILSEERIYGKKAPAPEPGAAETGETA